MLNFGASKPRVRGGARAPGAPPLDPHLDFYFTEKTHGRDEAWTVGDTPKVSSVQWETTASQV